MSLMFPPQCIPILGAVVGEDALLQLPVFCFIVQGITSHTFEILTGLTFSYSSSEVNYNARSAFSLELHEGSKKVVIFYSPSQSWQILLKASVLPTLWMTKNSSTIIPCSSLFCCILYWFHNQLLSVSWDSVCLLVIPYLLCCVHH